MSMFHHKFKHSNIQTLTTPQIATPTPPPTSKLADMEAALQQQANTKPVGGAGGGSQRPRLTGGIPPPLKRKAPVDPFIRKKPAKR